MLIDALFNIFFMVISVLVIPLQPLFSWVPLPFEVFGPVPAVFQDALNSVSPFLYILNLGPVITFFVIILTGAIGMRLLIMVFDVVLPPLPVIGPLYKNVMDFIRGVF